MARRKKRAQNENNVKKENQKEIDEAREYLQKVPGWLAIKLRREADFIANNENDGTELALKKSMIIETLQAFANAHAMEISIEEFNDYDFSIYMTGSLFMKQSDSPALMAFALADAWTVNVVESETQRVELIYTKSGHCLIEE